MVNGCGVLIAFDLAGRPRFAGGNEDVLVEMSFLFRDNFSFELFPFELSSTGCFLKWELFFKKSLASGVSFKISLLEEELLSDDVETEI